MDDKIQQAIPIIKGYLKRHKVPSSVYDEVFQTLRISLWKSIQKQETTHPDWKLTYLFEFQARSDLKQEYWLQGLIACPHKKLFDNDWKHDHMPQIFWLDDNPEEVDIFPSADISPEAEIELTETLSQLSDKEQQVLKGRYQGLSFKEIGQSMGLKSEIMPVTLMKGIRAKLGTIGTRIR